MDEETVSELMEQIANLVEEKFVFPEGSFTGMYHFD
jgi:hypothetical protein